MPSALFEIYQKNFDKTLKRLSGMLELYQNQTKEAQSITLKEIELNISELERSISQMELEVILEKIPDNKKKLGKIIENNKNIVKQYRREIQDLKYKEQSILNKKNLAYIPSNKKNKTTQLNFLKEKHEQQNIDIINFNEDEEDTALFIDKNNYKKNNSNNYDKYIINDSTNEEMNLQKDESIKRINEHYNDSDKDLISNINNIKISSKIKKNEDKDKDLENNKYKLNKDNAIKKIMKIISRIVYCLLTIMISFCKNYVYKGYIKLKNYLNHRYGQQNSRRIRMILFIIGFIIIYSLILYIWHSLKLKSPEVNPVNLINKNNTIISELKNETNNTSNNITNKIDIINNKNNNTNFSNNTIKNFNNNTSHSINNNTINYSNFNNATNNFNNTNNNSNNTFINDTISNKS